MKGTGTGRRFDCSLVRHYAGIIIEKIPVMGSLKGE